MYKQGNPLRKISLRGRAFHVAYRWVASLFIAAYTAAPGAIAQGNEDVPTIRVETREVLIPTLVSAWVPEHSYCPGVPDSSDCGIRMGPGYYPVLRLGPGDFHLFEDEKEQTIISTALMRPYTASLQRDNLGEQLGNAVTPMGEWKTLYPGPIHYLANELGTPLYAIAYNPPSSTDGSCHNIRITVDPKDASGHKQTTAESGAGSLPTSESASGVAGAVIFPSEEKKVNRSKLLLRYRTRFCNVALASSDPLYGTPVSKVLENLAAEEKEEQNGLYLSAFDLLDESGKTHIRVSLDFPEISNRFDLPDQSDLPDRSDLSELLHKTDLLRIPIALIGLFNRTNGSRAARFSDGTSQSSLCHFSAIKSVPANRKEQQQPAPDAKSTCFRWLFSNHYETEADLPPGDYKLRVAIDFGGVLRSVEVPVSVPAPTQQLAVSGIAMCRRYLPHNPIPFGLRLPTDDIPTMPFDLKPLVSKGFEFTPTGDAHFKATDFMAVYFEVFEPLLEDALLLPDGDKVRVQFEMRVVDAKTGEVKSDTGFRPADGFVNPDQVVIPINEQVAIGGLNPGDYQLQVRATDSAGNLTDWRSTSFTRE
jgi:hypothetical protein